MPRASPALPAAPEGTRRRFSLARAKRGSQVWIRRPAGDGRWPEAASQLVERLVESVSPCSATFISSAGAGAISGAVVNLTCGGILD